MYPLKASTAITIPFFAHDVNGDAVTGILDGSWTKRISKNGGAFAAMTVTITEMENGWYSLPLSASHTDTEGILTVSLNATGAKRVNLQWRVGVNEANLVQIDGLATSGNNATLNLKQLNISNSTGSAIVATSTGSNGHGIVATGQGTGHGISGVGGSSNGNGAKLLAGGSAAGLLAQGAGANGHGINAVAGAANAQGARFEGSGTGAGIFSVGGSTSGAHGVTFQGGSGGGFGMLVTGIGDNAGLRTVGGTGGTSGHGFSAAAGTGSLAHGINGQGDGSGLGMVMTGGANGHGVEFRGGSTNGSGCRMLAQASGEGLVLTAIGGTNAGLQCNGGGNGAGIEATGAGTGAGLRVAGGTTGDGMLLVGGATSGSGMTFSLTAGVPIASGFRNARAQAGSTSTTIVLDASASSNDDLYNGMRVSVYTGTAAGQSRLITDYVGSTKTATVTPAWDSTAVPASGDAFSIEPWGQVDVASLAAGSITSSTFAAGAITATVVADGTIDAATFAAGAINAAAIADGAIDAATFAAGAIDAAALSADAGTEIGTAVWASATRTLTAFSFSVTASSVTDKTGYSLAASGTDLVLVDGKTLPAALQIIAATTSGKVSGAGTGTETFVGLNGSTTRAITTVDSSGNRTAVSYP